MSKKINNCDTGFLSVDWATAQSRYFAQLAIPTPVLAQRCGVHPRQVDRWRNCETPLPLHRSFLVAEAARDYGLLDLLADDVRHILVPKVSGGSGTAMRTYFALGEAHHQLGPLVLKLERGEALSKDEWATYHALCRAVQQRAAALQELGRVAQDQKDQQ